MEETNKVLCNELTKNNIIKPNRLETCCGVPIYEVPKLKEENQQLQKQLEEKERMLEEYKKCNCKECMTDYEKNLNQIIDKYLYENNSFKQQLKSQPAEIVDEIKKQITNTHCYGLRINRIFEILDAILKEYQKDKN